MLILPRFTKYQELHAGGSRSICNMCNFTQAELQLALLIISFGLAHLSWCSSDTTLSGSALTSARSFIYFLFWDLSSFVPIVV
mmetsp:Transcript_19704/g.49259  ORF Transcript_19704/g.49259 Transcript_19704/m.49259 type:complete len:83 (+) Transcript_19704:59-307(+)